eukprot:TRINITY_DN13186_c0_g1_i2.p1 TRINITY_DN13186_c0_g1~~TRINITY_DN13186_c0_g1_i2.p1  ORF type:complete len:1136 (-),score=181.20 TRINITY_DN13186_c0_g1_i2:216-3386(-)
MYAIEEFLTMGGQARVWSGRDLKTKARVIFRFPLGMCENIYCKVHELPDSTLNDMHYACSLAGSANHRYGQLLGSRLEKLVSAFTPYSPFSKCLLPPSDDPDDVAFEVWSFDGEITLAEGFFLGLPGGVAMPTSRKRWVLRELTTAIGMLADGSLERGRCCCLQSRPHVCSTSIRGVLYGCPVGYVDREQDNACGPIVHHDIKFDNVLLKHVGSSFRPVVIDFGAAVRCDEPVSNGWSPEWVPPWQKDGSSFLHNLCWNYDFYGIGMLWLVTELLREQGPMALLCHAAIDAGLIDMSEEFSSYECWAYSNSDLRSAALIPVSHLVRDLHRQVLNTSTLQSEEMLSAGLKHFIEEGEALQSKETRKLTLTLPDMNILKKHVFPLLRNCQYLYKEGHMDSMNNEERMQVLRCRLDTVMHAWNDAAQKGDSRRLFEVTRQARPYCDSFKEWSSEEEAGSMMNETCAMLENGTQQQFVRSVSLGKYEDVQFYFRTLGRNDARELANTRLDGQSVLAWAAAGGHAKIVKLLLRHGAAPHMKDYGLYSKTDGRVKTPLLAAASRANNTKVLKLIVHAALDHQHGWKLFKADGQKLLLLVTEHGDESMLRCTLDAFLLAEKAASIGDNWELRYVSITHGAVKSALLAAAAAGNHVSCSLLLAAGSDLNSTDLLGRTPLMLAVLSGSVPTLAVFKNVTQSSGGSESLCNATAPKLGTALHIAASTGAKPEVVSALLGMCPDLPLQVDGQGDLPLHVAIRAADPALVRILAQSDAAQRQENSRQETALAMSARICDDLDVLKGLLETASPEALIAQTGAGETLPMVAATHGKLKCLTEIAKYVPLTSEGSWHRTPLMSAAEWTQPGSIRVLGQLGASARDRDIKGRPIPLLLDTRARTSGTSQVARLKEAVNAYFDFFGVEALMMPDQFGMNVLGRFILSGDFAIVRYLVDDLGVDCNMPFQQVTGEHIDALGSLRGVTPLDLSRKVLRLTRPPKLFFAVEPKSALEYRKALSHYQSSEVFSTDIAHVHANLESTERVLVEHGCASGISTFLDDSDLDKTTHGMA